MSRMKHLLRKLHLGGGGATPSDHRPRRRRHPPTPQPPPPPAAAAVAAVAEPVAAAAAEPVVAAAAEPVVAEPRGLGAGGGEMTRFEEEYQVQLALAISASDPAGLVDPDSVQIRAAERISLGCSGGGAGSGERSPMELLSTRYWNHSIVNYDERLMDGFYDVYGVLPDPRSQGKLPSLTNLKAMPISEGFNYVAVLVDRTFDSALQQLERRATAIAAQSVAEHGDACSAELVQKLASLVVDAMGGPVEDADDMNRKWSVKSQELCISRNSIVLPLGLLEIGLSRQRSLLFKVLADGVNLPCKLVKGIYYTGTDEGAINLIKIDFDSTEYIVDLMGAPGTLIPSEISSRQFQDSNSSQLSNDVIEESIAELCLALEQVSGRQESKNGMVEGSSSDEDSLLGLAGSQLEDKSRTENLLEQNFPCGVVQLNTFNIEEDISRAQQIKVNDVSKYVVTASKDPEFAQKLHAALLESGASPPAALFSDLNPPRSSDGKRIIGKSILEDKETNGWLMLAQPNETLLHDLWSQSYSIHPDDTTPAKALCWDQPVPSAPYVSNLGQNKYPGSAGIQWSNEATETISNSDLHGRALSNEAPRVAEDWLANASGSDSKDSEACSCSSTKRIQSVIDDVAEFEIPWDDLQIGERIGLGSYGEVYRADWHGTEVAVKKFLDQDLSGVALEQFKCEVKIMSRLRHPNVVLFMGSVTQPPNLSILTEYLPRGSLYRLLHRPNVHLDETRRLKMALDVAKGMNYLHTSHPTIVHRDLKSPNLLVDKNWVVKVSDFGLSRLKHHTFLSSRSTAGTPEWMAPEVLRNEPSNEKCDVYSFGVILWELATLRMPWGGLNPMQVVGAVGFQHRRLDIPKEVDPMVATIISSCWESDPSKRPSFSQLLSPLKQLQRLVVAGSC